VSNRSGCSTSDVEAIWGRLSQKAEKEKRADKRWFQRLSRKPEKLVKLELEQLRKADKLTPDLIFRDPCLLGFLGLKGAYAEKRNESGNS
jgi:predicted nuclease of restriction endonuclease-like (RecB) superfamily